MRSLPPAMLLAALLASACGGDDEMSIDDTVLAGTVNGQSWSFRSGETDAFLSEGEDNFFASLYATEVEACGFGGPDGYYVIAAVPKATGEYEMSSSLNLTFAVGDSDNLVTFDGVIRVDEVTDTVVRGGLAASYDGDNTVSGTFELTICADDT
jgi:hypothetical protein